MDVGIPFESFNCSDNNITNHMNNLKSSDASGLIPENTKKSNDNKCNCLITTDGFLLLDEKKLTPDETIFTFNIPNEAHISPYNYATYFKNCDFDSFTKKVTKLLKLPVIQEELDRTLKFHSTSKINNKYTIKYIISRIMDEKFNSYMNNIIINKRIEFLIDYMQEHHPNKLEHLDYIENLLESLYKSIKYISKKL